MISQNTRQKQPFTPAQHKVTSNLEKFRRWSKEIIQSLNNKKYAITSCVPVKYLIELEDIYLPILIDITNNALRNGVFLEELTLVGVTPLSKKAEPTE